MDTLDYSNSWQRVGALRGDLKLSVSKEAKSISLPVQHCGASKARGLFKRSNNALTPSSCLEETKVKLLIHLFDVAAISQ
jgi:hypothetical protein